MCKCKHIAVFPEICEIEKFQKNKSWPSKSLKVTGKCAIRMIRYAIYNFLLFSMSQSCIVSEILPYYIFLRTKRLRYVTLNTSLSGVIYHACISSPLYLSASTRHLKCLASPTPKMWLGPHFKKISRVTLTTIISGESVIPVLTLDIFYFYLYTKCSNSPFSRSRDMIAGVKTENGSCHRHACDPDRTPFTPCFRKNIHSYYWL